jgi:hypothetical protein
MTEKYHLRMTSRFGFYDERGTNMWHQFEPGDTVTDQGLIDRLESMDAPVQRIPTEFKR